MKASFRWLPALALAVAAVAAYASNGDQAVVAVAYDGIPQQVHPVLIQEIDGHPQPLPLRDTIWLAPGKHTLRLAATFDDNANSQRRNFDSRDAKHGVLEVDLQAGKRYLIGAKIEGRDATDWKPVVLRIEELRN